MILNLITFPLETVCMIVSEIYNKKFHNIRQYVDVISIILVLVICFLYKIKLPLRDGTIIGMFILGPLLGFFINLLEPAYLKYKLIKSPDEDL